MYKNILLPVDVDSKESWIDALPEALSIASIDKAKLTVLTVVPELGTIVAQAAASSPFTDGDARGWTSDILRTVKGHLKDFAKEHIPAEREATILVRSGSIYKEILEAAEEIGSDLIVVGSHRPDLRDYLMGPNAAKVVRHANCSVLVVRR